MASFDESLRARIADHLGQHRPLRRSFELEGRRHAAVAIVVVDAAGTTEIDAPAHDPVDDPAEGAPELHPDGVEDAEEGAAFLLCRRAARLNSHARQWALPGGRVDAGESVIDAALRELDEEVGLRLPPEAVLGLLDDYPTRSGYVITPVVVWGGGPVLLRPAADEVAHAYRISLDQLVREDSPRFIEIPESDRPVVQLRLFERFVHAPTAAVLVQFRWVGLEGRIGERVDHFEQPTFAWR